MNAVGTERLYPLTPADSYGVRRTACRTVEVRKIVDYRSRETHYEIRDLITRTTHERQNLQAARYVVNTIMAGRPPLPDLGGWAMIHHGPKRVPTGWACGSEQAGAVIWLTNDRDEGGWIHLSYTIYGGTNSWGSSYGWLTPPTRTGSWTPIKIQALTWVAHHFKEMGRS